MAEVEQITPPTVDKTKPEKDEAKPSGKKSKLKFNLIVIVMAQLVLAGGAFFMVSKFIKPDPAYQEVLEGQNAAGEEGQGEDTGGGEASEHRQIYLIEDVIVNPAGTRGSRYLSVSIGVEMNGSESKAESGGHGDSKAVDETSPLDAKKAQLRDALISILSSKTIIELTTPEEKEKVRQEILTKFSEILAPEPVYQIYFVDFVLQ